jgi:hypothetical protein
VRVAGLPPARPARSRRHSITRAREAETLR